jgi:hypothetical protein
MELLWRFDYDPLESVEMLMVKRDSLPDILLQHPCGVGRRSPFAVTDY